MVITAPAMQTWKPEFRSPTAHVNANWHGSMSVIQCKKVNTRDSESKLAI